MSNHINQILLAPRRRRATLIVMKQATGRPQDLADAALLRDILEQQREQSERE